MNDLRTAAKDLIHQEINQAMVDLATREGEEFGWMRLQQGFIRGLTHAISLIDNAHHTLGD
jgi:hypothetical protein